MAPPGDNLSTEERIRQIHHAISGDPQYGTEGLLQKIDRIAAQMVEHEKEDNEKFKEIRDLQKSDNERINDLVSRAKAFIYLGGLIVFLGIVVGLVNGFYNLPFVKDKDKSTSSIERLGE